MTMTPETLPSTGDDLHMQLTGLASENEPFARRVIWEMLEDRLPRGAQSRVRIHISNVIPGGWSSWHVHNGPSYHLLLQGRVVLERAGEENEAPDWRTVPTYAEEYKAGDAFAEPVGIPHRAGNPDPETTLVVVTFHCAEIDRHHIVTLGYDRPDGTPA